MRLSNATKNLVLVVASVASTLVMAEIALRAMGFSYPSFHRYDSTTGASLRPGAQGWYRDEGEAYVKINSAGMRDDREISIVKAADTYRIAVIGDSYSEALQIPTSKTYLALTEKSLNECAGFKGSKKVEILNFGVSGHSTAQELLTLRSRVWPYQPDLVLLQFLSGNDVRDNSKALVGNYPRPFFNLAEGHLALDNSFRDSAIAKLKSSTSWEWFQIASDYLKLVQLIYKAKYIFGQPLSAPTSVVESNGSAQVGIDDAIYFPPSERHWSQAWLITEQLLVAIWAETKAHQAQFLLMDFTNGIDVFPEEGIREKYMRQIGVHNLSYPHTRIERLAKREGIPFLGLWAPFSDHAIRTKTYLHGFPKTGMGAGHWNTLGHALAAQYISARICSEAEQAIGDSRNQVVGG